MANDNSDDKGPTSPSHGSSLGKWVGVGLVVVVVGVVAWMVWPGGSGQSVPEVVAVDPAAAQRVVSGPKRADQTVRVVIPALEVDAVTVRLRDPDDAVAAEGLALIRAEYKRSTNKEVTANSNRTWVAAATAADRYELAADLCLEAALGPTWKTEDMQQLIRMRVMFLLMVGKPEQALADAKSFYNVCPMRKSQEAIDLICTALYDLHKDPALVKKFRDEQAAAATVNASASAGRPSMLRDIKVDAMAARCDERLSQVDFEKRLGDPATSRGNLLLLKDAAPEALELFQKVYAAATPQRKMAAGQDVARAMRAVDGGVGRANAWLAGEMQANGTQAPVSVQPR